MKGEKETKTAAANGIGTKSFADQCDDFTNAAIAGLNTARDIRDVKIESQITTTTPNLEMIPLSAPARAWAARRRQGLSRTQLIHLLIDQEERCALSGAPLLFRQDAAGTPQKDGLGVHPLSPAVDHIECGTGERGYQIVCYALNDVKGHIPFDCFEALARTEPWMDLMRRWSSQAASDPLNREAFRKLIFPRGNLRK